IAVIAPALSPQPATADSAEHAKGSTGVSSQPLELTFAELEARSLDVAHRLDALLEPNDRLVAIVMEKGFEQIVAALAVLETGRAFLPISAGQPDARIATILEQSGARIALTQPRLR